MRRLTLFLSFILLAGAGCFAPAPAPQQQTPPPEAEAPSPSMTVAGSWRLTGFATSEQPARDVSEIGATLDLSADGRMSAVICNSMSGAYAVEDGRVKTSEVASTLKLCTGELGDIEAAFTQGLAAGLIIEAVGEQLFLRTDAGARFTFAKATDQEEPPQAGDRAASGEIVRIDLEKIAVDGPAVIVIRTEAGAQEEIRVPSFGIRLCAAQESIADVYDLRVGQRVDVNGSVGEGDSIIPCSSASHYLRVAE